MVAFSWLRTAIAKFGGGGDRLHRSLGTSIIGSVTTGLLEGMTAVVHSS
jgi:hypothetical protein